MPTVPIDGQIILLTAAKASVPPARLPDLLERTSKQVNADLERYRREYERLYKGSTREAFLVSRDHWDRRGAHVGLTEREIAAVCRAHEEQLLRVGRRTNREVEFETALEIRDPVFVATKQVCDEGWQR